jgi:methionyl-tRNA formyltransferase
MKVAILTSPEQWFVTFAEALVKKISGSTLFFRHEEVGDEYGIVFILSYHQIIPKEMLDKHQHNVVVHASALPLGKGWSPLFWQVIEGKKNIPFTLFEATEKMDEGNIYMQENLMLTGYELNDELRLKQAKMTQKMCLKFIENHPQYRKPKPQKGSETIYSKRTEKSSQLDPDKTLREQFNLLRTVNNKTYPAFFELDGHRYILKISEDK